MSADRLAGDVAVALRLLTTGSTNPELWTTSDRQAVTRLHVWRDAEQANAQEADRQPVPGVYSADQANRQESLADMLERVQRAHDETMEDRLARLRHVRTQRDAALADLEAERVARSDTAAQLHVVTEERNRLQVAVRREVDAKVGLEARLASECRAHNVTAELVESQAHRLEAYDDLQRKAEQGMAVVLAGRVYVQRDLLVASVQSDLAAQPLEARVLAKHSEIREQVGEPFAGADATLLGPGTYEGTALLEARSGVFVPIPEGHMLSVTVTPYDTTPEPDTMPGAQPLG